MMVKKWLKDTKRLMALTVVTALTIGMTATTALAGFEWTPPPAKKTAPPVVAVPAPAVEKEKLDSSFDSPAMSPLPETEVHTQTVVPVIEPQQAPAMAVMPAMKQASPQRRSHSASLYEEAVGFGNDIPLVLVMQQIVPPHFSYSFDPGVNPGERVSWNGGRPWDEVLADAVRPLGLDVVISDNTVWIRRNGGASMARATPKQAPFMAQPMHAGQASPLSIEPQPMSIPAPTYERAPQTDFHQSYPRRQRSVPLSRSAPETAGGNIGYNAQPVPLMKALPPPPEPTSPGSPAMMPSPAPARAATPQAATPVAHQASANVGALDPYEIRFWQAEKGTSLKQVLSQWTDSANVAMLWNSAYDYTVPVPVRLHGTFPDAVTNLLMSFNTIDPRPLGRLHPNLPDGPSVLVVEHYSQATH